MRLPIYQIDAFTNRLFAGNPAAVIPLEEWLPDSVLQAIALENNLSETAFFMPERKAYRLRWFTPAVEVDLCGHATLASAYVIANILNPSTTQIVFNTKSGKLFVTTKNKLITMDFPAQPAVPCPIPKGLVESMGKEPIEVLQSIEKYMSVFTSEHEILDLVPDMTKLKKLDRSGLIVTASGNQVDFVSRFFAPKLGIDEDPVTGSAHCILTPYWSKKLNKSRLHAFQLSHRGGELFCEDCGDRVMISGQAVKYMEGYINI